MTDAAVKDRPAQKQLPGFEGIVPTGATISFTGSTQLPSSAPPVGPDEVAYFLVEAAAEEVGHKKMARTGWTRRQVLEVKRILRVDEAEAIAALGDDSAVIDFSHAHRNDDLGDEQSIEGQSE